MRAIGPVTIIGRGHAAISASHGKTVEFAGEQEIGPRATCVAAVGARVESGDLLGLRGWIDLTIEADGVSDVIRAHANPALAAGDRLVVRRHPVPVRDALLIEADKGASDLDPRLVAALANPESTVTATLAPAEEERPSRGALIVSPGAPWSSSRAEPADVTLRSPLTPQDVELATRELDGAAHIALDADLAGDPAAVSLVQAAWSRGHFVLPADGLGPLPSALAVAGVDLSSVNVTDLRSLARREPDATCVAVTAPSGDVAKAIGAIEKTIPGARGVVVLDAGTGSMHAIPWQSPAESTVQSRRGRSAIIVAAPSASDSRGAEPLPRAVAVLAAELVARGASTREVSAALQRATGMSRKAAYEAALGLVPPDS
ncbi:MAG TPA: DUF371 domain-containing protein [Thermoleophilaceae bacterium]|nr:DUF371 domain-containing protein [Thermoleophilaceae bacterium]